MDLASIAYVVSTAAIPVLLAITVHEAAHGWVAWRLGDDTAFRLGRVTFNPLRHIDPIGTILMPATLLLLSGGRFVFGFAKPVPVSFRRLRSPRRDTVLVAAAGPGVNFAMAIVGGVLMPVTAILPPMVATWFGDSLENLIWINVLLAVFNLLPIPPLDGGRILTGLLPPALAAPFARLEPIGILLVLAAAFVLPWLGREIGMDLDVLRWLVFEPAERIAGLILSLGGGD